MKNTFLGLVLAAPMLAAAALVPPGPAIGTAIAAPAYIRGLVARLRGDVTGDGLITSVDALGLLTHIVGRPLPAGHLPVPHGDANCDGRITATDALIILSHVVGRSVSAFCINRVSLTSIVVAPESTSLAIGDTVRLTASTRDSDGALLAGRALAWSSADTTIARVDASGGVRAMRGGTTTIRATAEGVTGSGRVIVAGLSSNCLALNYTLGQSQRFTLDTPGAARCFDFDAVRNASQQYLVMLENLPLRGNYGAGVFPAGINDNQSFAYTLSAAGVAGQIVLPPVSSGIQAPEQAVSSWDFGAGPIYEVEPLTPPESVPHLRLQRPDGNLVALDAAGVAPIVGDTLSVWLEGIPRLGILGGDGKAVIRYISNELIIAEDARILRAQDSTFIRSGGLKNTPLTDADMVAIATEYAAYAKVQGDLLFGGRHNARTDTLTSGRVVAVHSMMFSDNIWGYTYSSQNYFVWDYWVSTDGRTKGLAQHAQRNSDNLFMHEIAHMRHWGLLERAARTAVRGNRWLVEGFARFSERLPIAARLLATQSASRTGNVVLPRNPAFGGSAYLDDVPSYYAAGNSMFGGYQASSYIFDYFADHVALAGRPWLAPLVDFVTKAGVEADLNATIAAQFPGMTFPQLFSRARIALYADDYPLVVGLPAWTQYPQFQLRASRGTTTDPRVLWSQVTPGVGFTHTLALQAGGAWGYLIDGVAGAAHTRITLDAPSVSNGVLSMTRIR